MADALNIPIENFVITTNELLGGDIEALAIADEVWRRACASSTPEHVSDDQVESRGTGPAYWLRT